CHYTLPASINVSDSRLRPRARERPHRQIGRQGARGRARGEGIRVGSMTALVDFGIREQAAQRFEQLGWPTPRLEEWKYTNLAPIQRARWKRQEPAKAGAPLRDGGGGARASSGLPLRDGGGPASAGLPMHFAGAVAELVFVNGI